MKDGKNTKHKSLSCHCCVHYQGEVNADGYFVKCGNPDMPPEALDTEYHRQFHRRCWRRDPQKETEAPDFSGEEDFIEVS